MKLSKALITGILFAGAGNAAHAEAPFSSQLYINQKQPVAAAPAPLPAAPQTLQSEVSKQVIAEEKREDGSFLTLNFENDMIGGGSDQNYTSGVRATYYKMGATVPDFFNSIDDLIPTFSINKTTSIYYSFGQNLYTPEDITQKAQDPRDRPWSAFLYASAGLNTITNNHIDNLETTIGVIGPPALGKPIQKFIHKHISDSPVPEGWGNQLEFEPGIMLSWERSWPESYNFEALGWNAAAVPHAGVTLGNIYTYANGGVSFRLTPYDGRWQDDPVRVRPAMPGTGAFLVPENTFNWYLFGGIEGRAVAQNIFLDGNTFTDSYSVDKKHFVADANAGIALTYNKVRLSYTLVYRTAEFHGQDGGDVFGSISLGVRF